MTNCCDADKEQIEKDFMDDRYSKVGEEMLCRQTLYPMISLRDTLVEMSQVMRDLLYEVDVEGRLTAEEITQNVLKTYAGNSD